MILLRNLENVFGKFGVVKFNDQNHTIRFNLILVCPSFDPWQTITLLIHHMGKWRHEVLNDEKFSFYIDYKFQTCDVPGKFQE